MNLSLPIRSIRLILLSQKFNLLSQNNCRPKTTKLSIPFLKLKKTHIILIPKSYVPLTLRQKGITESQQKQSI